MPAPSTLPTHARVVVIGGGIIGCSVAYHLAQMGCADVVLLERDRITSGTTWHAAGLMVTFGSTSETATDIRKYTRDLYARLEAETARLKRVEILIAAVKNLAAQKELSQDERKQIEEWFLDQPAHGVAEPAEER